MLDDDLRALLDVRPSPHFEARVRARVRTQASSRDWLFSRAPAVVVVVAIAVVAVALLSQSIERDAPVESSSRMLASHPVALHHAAEYSARVEPQPVGRDATPRVPGSVARASQVIVRGAQVRLDRAETQALQQLFSGTSTLLGPTWTAGPAQELSVSELAIERLEHTDGSSDPSGDKR